MMNSTAIPIGSGQAPRSASAQPWLSNHGCAQPPRPVVRRSMLAALELCDVADQNRLLRRKRENPAPNGVARPGKTTLQWLADDPESSHLINFPFALMIFILLLAGSLLMSSGLIVANVGATAIGFLIVLLGTALYCGRLPEG